ncbi:MAG: ATPase [Marinilabiliaceae bacterium]|nr:ATPase [Marinilabiliaceae bacterium]
MILIADAGSTKTKWAFVDENRHKPAKFFTSRGINAIRDDDETVKSVLSELPLEGGSPFSFIHFYGAGCVGGDVNTRIQKILADHFSLPIEMVEVESDLVGASLALCGREAGVACILGTGSNSALWDGNKIVKNIRPLGYILGDEGSGAHIGKLLIADWLKGLLPADLAEELQKRCNLSYPEMIASVYRRPEPNRFMADFTHFVSEHIDNTYLQSLVKKSFAAFVERNLLLYDGIEHLKVNFTGSVAMVFRRQLDEVLVDYGLTIGRVEPDPLPLMLDLWCN